jgi:hypothetical protein
MCEPQQNDGRVMLGFVPHPNLPCSQGGMHVATEHVSLSQCHAHIVTRSTITPVRLLKSKPLKSSGFRVLEVKFWKLN